jgi:hypothetical protein
VTRWIAEHGAAAVLVVLPLTAGMGGSATARATATTAQPAAGQTLAAHARTVLAAVVTGRGMPLVDVDLDDFVVTEGARPREVLDVHVADYPLALLVDDRPGTADALAVIRTSARRFVERIGERPIAVFRLSDAAEPLTSLDSDRSAVLDAIDRITPASLVTAAGTLETIGRAAGLLQASSAPFSAVVGIAAASIDAAELVRGELLTQVQASGAAVHVVQAAASGPDAPVGPAESGLLRVMADQTRGQFTPIFSTASFEAALDRLADRLAIEMMIQYLVPEGPKTGDVRVGVRIPGARVVGLGVK